MTGLYVHIPFCARKCAYCDFLSFPAGPEEMRLYTGALTEEIRAAGRRGGNDPVDTVYIGGGTPSVMPAPLLEEVLRAAAESFSVREDAEVTVEMNPGAADGVMEILRNTAPADGKTLRPNRVSLGIQSFHDGELGSLGRIHTAREAEETFLRLREAGVRNLSVDLMFGIPGQTEESFLASLEKACALGPEHISCYSLILEEGTPMWERYCGETEEEGCARHGNGAAGNAGKKEIPAPLPDEETERRMAHTAARFLAENGYEQYEISNFAKPGKESRHNLRYWQRRPYLGFGLGAASFSGERRWKNTSSMRRYLTREYEREEEEVLTEKDRMAETMFLGLRMLRGVDTEAFRDTYGRTAEEVYGGAIRKNVRDGLLAVKDGRIVLTARGLDLANTVMCDFL